MDTGKASWQPSPGHDKEFVVERWRKLVQHYDAGGEKTEGLLQEIILAYSKSKRFYHNLTHIAALLRLCDEHAEKLSDKEVVDFSIFYHDIIYKVTSSDNELKSAKVAEKRLAELNVAAEKIRTISLYIEATKTHDVSDAANKNDLEYFLDFDMAILGADWDEYAVYTQNIRKEYSIYPDFMYYKGRESFLKSALQKDKIFHTSLFKSLFEEKARQNMMQELNDRVR